MAGPIGVANSRRLLAGISAQNAKPSEDGRLSLIKPGVGTLTVTEGESVVQTTGTCQQIDLASMCARINTKFKESRLNPKNKKLFLELVGLLRTSLQDDIKIHGVIPPVARYRSCYDQGFTTKISDTDGELVVDKRFGGPLEEKDVYLWFLYARQSNFP